MGATGVRDIILRKNQTRRSQTLLRSRVPRVDAFGDCWRGSPSLGHGGLAGQVGAGAMDLFLMRYRKKATGPQVECPSMSFAEGCSLPSEVVGDSCTTYSAGDLPLYYTRATADGVPF